MEEERQVDRVVSPVPMASVRERSRDRPRSSATSAASRQARTGTIAPRRIADHWAAAKETPRSAIGMAARNDGSGSQTSNAARGISSGGVW